VLWSKLELELHSANSSQAA